MSRFAPLLPELILSIGGTILMMVAAFTGRRGSGLVSWLGTPARLLPYHYYSPSAILSGTSIGSKPLLGFMVCIILLTIAAWIGFRRRDIG